MLCVCIFWMLTNHFLYIYEDIKNMNIMSINFSLVNIIYIERKKSCVALVLLDVQIYVFPLLERQLIPLTQE